MVAKQYFGEPCETTGCGRSAVTRGLCGMHYQRWKKYGHVDSGRAARTMDGRVVGADGYVSIRLPNHRDGTAADSRVEGLPDRAPLCGVS